MTTFTFLIAVPAAFYVLADRALNRVGR